MNNGNIIGKIMRRVRRTGKSHPIAACIAAIAGSGLVWYGLFGFTPLGNLLPSRFDPAVRQGYEMLAAKVDSLQHAADLNCRHADLIRMLITGELDTSATAPVDIVPTLLPVDSLPDAGDAEKAFVRRMEANRTARH